MQKNIDNIEKESDKSNQIVITEDKEYDERDQIRGRKENVLESEESETDERDQIEHPGSLNIIDSQQNR